MNRGKKTLSEADQILFTAATAYLKGVMNGQLTLPVKAWKAEYAKLTAEHKTLNHRYISLKDKVKEAEQIRKSVYDRILKKAGTHQHIIINYITSPSIHKAKGTVFYFRDSPFLIFYSW